MIDVWPRGLTANVAGHELPRMASNQERDSGMKTCDRHPSAGARWLVILDNGKIYLCGHCRDTHEEALTQAQEAFIARLTASWSRDLDLLTGVPR